MHVLAVVGHSDSGKTTLIERLTERLSERGTVGTIKHIDCEPDLDTDGKDTARHRAAGSTRTYGLTDEEWFATGESLSLSDALDELAPTHDYALVEGYRNLSLPNVVLGVDDGAVNDDETDTSEKESEQVIARAPTADDIDLEELIAELDQLEPYETLGSLVATVKESPDSQYAGAIATFTGRVRELDSPEDDRTEYLEFEKYDAVADEQLATIREELESREGVYAVRMHHKTGVVEGEEDIVFVVVLAGHRTEAFETVEDGINRLKAEVPLFKKEVTVSETFWAHER